MPAMDWKLELVPIPVSDVDAAKRFYMEKMGFTLDHDVSPNAHFRVVQLTPPGSACSICFGRDIVKRPPGSVQGLHLVVSDIHAARTQLMDRGVEVSEVQELGTGIFFVFLKDPDGNSWAVQRIAPETRRPQGGQP
jgi:catechol 2,3-dioxygenase-like lactoylglutathione lyase family enzyme